MGKAPHPRDLIFLELEAERLSQDKKWGEQNHRDGTGSGLMRADAAKQRSICEEAFKHGNGSWRHILAEETAEAYAESDPQKLRKELVQVAAVAISWIEAIDRRPR